MASRKKIKKEREERGRSVGPETVQAVLGVFLFALATFFSFAALGHGGWVGDFAYSTLKKLVGVGYFAIPVTLILLGISSFKNIHKQLSLVKWFSAVFLFLSLLGLINMASSDGGGILGGYISRPLINLFDTYVTGIFLLALLTSSALIILDAKISLPSMAFLTGKVSPEKKKLEERNELGKKSLPFPDDSLLDEETEEETPVDELARDEDAEEISKPQKPLVIPTMEPEQRARFGMSERRFASYQKFIPIPLDLLEGDRGKPGVGDIKANANIIKRTLQNFGIDVEMDEISIGPSVTRYALKPAEGVKLSKIVALQNDLALALAAHPIRIEAPIPGKSLVGIEIPNSVKTTVGLGSLLSADEFQNSDKPLLVSLGKGISGKSHFGNLAKMPHMLIAGATGSGKSVTIHAVITSLLYRNSPENLKFIMIDPKRVELTLYNKIPHLLTPVITDAKKAIQALRWAAKEMDRRYDILESEQVRDIESYHKNILEPELKRLEQKGNSEQGEEKIPETMPYIVVILDELADIMTSYPRELEAAIVRLAQMSRAVGIHLILSTQRPSVNVITGLIKANVPARVALQVASQIDSRTILDMAGAEKLLGAGDMLYLSGEMSKPQRIQSAFISENEVKKVVKFLADKYEGELGTQINLGENTEKDVVFDSMTESSGPGDDDDDELYEEAREEVLRAGKASTSYLQRKLRIGYARAARLIDLLEQRNVIGKGEGAKPREVLGSPIPQEEVPPQE